MLLISLITFVMSLASSILAPAVPQVMTSFGNNNSALASFVISVYVIGFALGPLLIALLSELYGGAIVYHTSNVLFLAFTVGCALSSNISMFIAFRFLSGCVGVTTGAVGGGSMHDLIPVENMGTAMSMLRYLVQS